MNQTSEDAMEKISPFVTKVVMYVNAFLLLCHIGFAFVFKLYNADIAFGYNILSIVIYIFTFWVLIKEKSILYITLVYSEIMFFMIITVVCVGWDFGFQQWSMAFVTSTVFVDFFLNRSNKIKKTTWFLIALDVLIFIGLRIYTYSHPAIYNIDNNLLVHTFFLVNSLIGFAFMITLSYVYTNMVHRLEKSLVDIANIDPLTGLCNRRKMYNLLRTLTKDTTIKNNEFCVAMLDVDHFKIINDTYGHDIGDEVLKTLASILTKKSKENPDFHVCRWGGEEFLICYTHYNKSKREIIAEFDSLRNTIKEKIIKSESHEFNITVTIGVAFYNVSDTETELIKEADKNLYSGKESGRDQVVVNI